MTTENGMLVTARRLLCTSHMNNLPNLVRSIRSYGRRAALHRNGSSAGLYNTRAAARFHYFRCQRKTEYLLNNLLTSDRLSCHLKFSIHGRLFAPLSVAVSKSYKQFSSS